MSAKRLNASDFKIMQGITFQNESDGAGGYRYYFPTQTSHTITLDLNTTRFWLYGVSGPKSNTISISYNTTFTEQVILFLNNKYILGYPIHISGYLQETNLTIKLDINLQFQLHCIYYEEPMYGFSVGLKWMERTSNPICSLPGNDDSTNLIVEKDSQQFGCEKDNLNTPNAYNCGLRCYTSNVVFQYTFRGEKFAIYGSFDPNHGKFDVFLNGNLYHTVSQYATSNQRYKLLYESPILEYKNYTVRLKPKGGKDVEFHKLVYWPSIIAKRLNSTQRSKTSTWRKESDGIGGAREYTTPEHGGKVILAIPCSKFWIFGFRDNDPNLENAILTYNGITETIVERSDSRDENTLIYESPLIEASKTTILIEIPKTFMFNCIYYIEPQCSFFFLTILSKI